MSKCPVCGKSCGGGSFTCHLCREWIHPKCGGYKVREVQKASNPESLVCNNCRKVTAMKVEACASVVTEVGDKELDNDTTAPSSVESSVMSPPERIVRSREIAVEFLRGHLPEYYVKPVPGDGFCIIYAFQESLLSIGRKETFESITSTLQAQLGNLSSFVTEDINLEDEFNNYMVDPLSQYDKDTTDIFLDALGLGFGVNVVVFKSNCTKCEILNLINPENNFQDTLYFVKSEAVHVEPVVPVLYREDIEEIESDSDDSIVLTNFVPSSKQSTGAAGVKQETVDEQLHFDIESPREPLRPLNDLPSTSSSVTAPDGFDFINPSAEHLLYCIMINPSEYEVSTPLQRCRENKLYTIKGCTQSDITADGNGAYNKANTGRSKVFFDYDENGIISVNKAHGYTDNFYYKKRVSAQDWQDVVVPNDKIYCVERYYRHNKTIPGLKMMVVHIVSVCTGYVHPYFCVVYSLENLSPEEVMEIPCLPHGNSMDDELFSTPYQRTHRSVLEKIDSLVDIDTPSNVFYDVLKEAGGPMSSSSQSMEPRNVKQVMNRKSIKKRKQNVEGLPVSSILNSNSDLERLILEQRDPSSPVQTVLVSRDNYIAFIYTAKQLKDIEMFCCDPNKSNVGVLGIDTTFKLCDLWVTDTSYRNERLLSRRTRNSPVHLGPIMLHFTKDEETFRRFCLEMISANPAMLDLRKVGVDMEAAIFKGFRSVLVQLVQLYCVRHVQQRDEKAIDNLQQKDGNADEKTKAARKQQILWDLYGKRTNERFEEGLADSKDSDDLTAKLVSLKPRWEKFCPGFFNWFMSNRKKAFAESIIKSARAGTTVQGLYYQNDIESLHARQKRQQCYGKGSVLDCVNTLKTLIEREMEEEVLALYNGTSKYVLARPFQKWFVPNWHSWDDRRKERHLLNFRSAQPSLEDSFTKPANSGQKPGYKQRKRIVSPPSVIVDRHEPPTTTTSTTTTLPSFVTAAAAAVQVPASTSLQTSLHSPLGSQPTTISTGEDLTILDASDTSISFPDPRVPRQTVFELFIRSDLPKKIVKCRGNCGETITEDLRLLVKSQGNSQWYDVATQGQRSRYGPLYIHFKDDCLKTYDTANYYAPNEPFNYAQVKLNQGSKRKLSDADLAYLSNLGIN